MSELDLEETGIYGKLCVTCDSNRVVKSDKETAVSMAWNHKHRETDNHETYVLYSEFPDKEYLENKSCLRFVHFKKVSGENWLKQIHQKKTENETVCGKKTFPAFSEKHPHFVKVTKFCPDCWNFAKLCRSIWPPEIFGNNDKEE